MGRHNIQFKGLRHSPSDITGQDGDLLECVNLIHDNGELKPIEMPERTRINGKLKNGNSVLVAVHNLTDGKKFVFALFDGNGTVVSYKNDENNTEINIKTIAGEQIQWAETIGNTLIIGTDKSTHYALYKNGAYKWLGDKLPQPIFTFDLSEGEGEIVYEPNPYGLDENGDTVSGGGIPIQFRIHSQHGQPTQFDFDFKNTTEENKKIFVDNIKAKMAVGIARQKKNGYFLFPFFVRYALRLFDGNYAMHSSPFLMLPATNKGPIIANLSFFDIVDDTRVVNVALNFKSKTLKYKHAGWKDADGNDISDISDWKDVIKGVDIYLSSQINPYNMDYYGDLNNVDTYYWHGSSLQQDYGSAYFGNQKVDMASYLSSFINDWNEVFHGAYKNYELTLPTFSSENINDKIKKINVFYRIKQYQLEDLIHQWNAERELKDEVEYGELERLETLTTLQDDYVSRCRISGNANYNYNQRLLLGNIRLQAPLWYQDSRKFSNNHIDYVIIDFIIEKPEKTICIEYRCEYGTERLGKYDFGHYLYYPDPDCKKAIVTIYNGGARYIEIPMNEHDGLNGAYALMPDLKSLWESYSDFGSVATTDLPNPSSDYERYYGMRNTIAMSGVANPFHFPSSNFKDIGRAEVIGIAANTLDVSSGQWGQYPLYVFCSDGIIAVMIDGEGKFGGIQAVSADVLREPIGLSRPTLVQTGQMLMFLTQRGVMAIAGTKIQCVSEAMGGRHFNTVRELPDAGQNVGSFISFIKTASDDTAFRDFAASAFLAYDYAHNRILVLRPDREYQYVYSLNTGMWSKEIIYTNLANMQVSDIHVNDGKGFGGVVKPLQVKPIGAAVNNYTEMYLQDSDSWLYRTMDVADENNTKQLYQYGYFVSRPIRFGTDEYKTITRLLHRYTHYATGSNVRLALYGSRDGVKYGRINTLRGMSYPYFIFVIFTYLKPNERYSYVSVDFETRLTNKLR